MHNPRQAWFACRGCIFFKCLVHDGSALQTSGYPAAPGYGSSSSQPGYCAGGSPTALITRKYFVFSSNSCITLHWKRHSSPKSNSWKMTKTAMVHLTKSVRTMAVFTIHFFLAPVFYRPPTAPARLDSFCPQCQFILFVERSQLSCHENTPRISDSICKLHILSATIRQYCKLLWVEGRLDTCLTYLLYFSRFSFFRSLFLSEFVLLPWSTQFLLSCIFSCFLPLSLSVCLSHVEFLAPLVCSDINYSPFIGILQYSR